MHSQSIRYYLSLFLQAAATLLLLGVVFIDSPELPAGEMAAQWSYLGKAGFLYSVLMLAAVFIYPYNRANIHPGYYHIVTWSLIFYGGIEAIWGLIQLYGIVPSNHSMFSLTGTFYNPGPYSGYLAMVFPLCLYEYLCLRKKYRTSVIKSLGYFASLGVLLLILIVLPSGMSRSSWLAAVLSGLWVIAVHFQWKERLAKQWKLHRKKMIGFVVTGVLSVSVVFALLFLLKKDSANGRLFMWKISLMAIAEKPVSGYGKGSFPVTYGEMQEAYFARGDYSATEEYIAGSPEYAFNEYLHVAIEYGVPVLILALLVVAACMYSGLKQHRIGICASVFSLLVFSFSSYPFYFPAFIIAFILLLFSCVPGKKAIVRIAFSLIIFVMSIVLYQVDDYKECREWAACRTFYNNKVYDIAAKEYKELYPILNKRSAFMFEYGYCLHKLEKYQGSNDIMAEASQLSSDPMILNIIGKNYQSIGQYGEAEKWFLRSINRLPGRIYPYYLLAKLYAEPSFLQPEKFRDMVNVVLTKQPKVHSTAIEEMRDELRKMSETNNQAGDNSLL